MKQHWEPGKGRLKHQIRQKTKIGTYMCRKMYAIKEKYKVANIDWVDHQSCSLLQYIIVITYLLIMRNYFNKLRWKIIRANSFFLFLH